jgi:hypothetical protein
VCSPVSDGQELSRTAYFYSSLASQTTLLVESDLSAQLRSKRGQCFNRSLKCRACIRCNLTTEWTEHRWAHDSTHSLYGRATTRYNLEKFRSSCLLALRLPTVHLGSTASPVKQSVSPAVCIRGSASRSTLRNVVMFRVCHGLFRHRRAGHRGSPAGHGPQRYESQQTGTSHTRTGIRHNRAGTGTSHNRH